MIDKKNIPAEFDKIARRYDIANRVISFGMDAGWKRRFVSMIPPDSRRILDIAAGTGDIAIKTARSLPEADLTAIDASENMLAAAADKAQKNGLANRINFQKADMLRLPFDDGSFDCVTMVYGLRNAADTAAAIREIHRVLRPGAAALIMEFTMPPAQPMRFLFGVYFRFIMPVIAAAFTGNLAAYRYLNKTVTEFYPPEKTAAIIKNAGFDVEKISLAGGAVWIFRTNKAD
ncbi:Demethylmenaquinone methyltransferase [Limihaloglobus sulfuriphilus]|uniref:Demethylmenaquinone methyltransferase n=1 Tax=Limihaloglobus sulfuriphilus TaxID=1851148 RepID=A0A1Q2MAS0_9BACT|nr:ubiquinone/menaquinone biosynthesis methyltransferase [Limihaloglobus sulfuriphilus]AQQ69823.1 Demethylmenaquinone methyltransferase [Limihaloglobus sulfuriphilus]